MSSGSHEFGSKTNVTTKAMSTGASASATRIVVVEVKYFRLVEAAFSRGSPSGSDGTA